MLATADIRIDEVHVKIYDGCKVSLLATADNGVLDLDLRWIQGKLAINC